MKANKNKLFALLLGLFTLFSFSSCDPDDDQWISTTLDFKTDVPVYNNGNFNQTIRLDDSFIYNFRPGRDELLDIRTLNSWLTISNMLRPDRVHFSLIANGNLKYDFIGTVSPDKNGEFYIQDEGFYSFMRDAIDVMRVRGFVDITIFGTSNISDGGPLIFNFGNNVDIHLR